MESKQSEKKYQEQNEKKDAFKSHRLFQQPQKRVLQSFSDNKAKAFLKPVLSFNSPGNHDLFSLRIPLQQMRAGKYHEAIKLFLVSTIDCDQDNLNSYLVFYYLSGCYSGLGNFLEARRFIDKAIAILFLEIPELEKKPDILHMKSTCFLEKGIIHHNLANHYLNDGDITRYKYEIITAQNYIQKAIEAQPVNHEAYNALGILQATQGDYEVAKKSYERTIFLKPHYAAAHTNLGALLKAEGDPKKAIEHFNVAISLEPNNGSHYYNRGLAYQALGQFDEAIEDLLKSIELDPSQCRYKIALAMNWLHKGDGESVISYLTRLLVEYPNNINIIVNLSAALSMIGQYQQAVVMCNKVLEQKPDELPCLLNLAMCYYMLADYEKALTTLDKIISDLRIENSHLLRYSVYGQIAQIMTHFKYFDEAINTYQTAYELCPSVTKKARIDFQLGNLYFDNRDYPEALFRYQRANIVLQSETISDYITETKAMNENPENIPTARVHIDLSQIVIPSDEFKNELEENLEFKLCRVNNNSISYSKSLKAYPLLKYDEIEERNPKLYELSKGEDDVWRKRGIYRMSSGELKVAAGSNKYNFVVTVDGDNPPKIIIGHVGHFYLSKQEDVLFAGEIVIKNGKIGMWNNISGHFMPRENSAEVVAKATKLPLEKFFSLGNINNLLQVLYAKYQNIEKMAKTYDMRDLAFGDKRIVKSMCRRIKVI